MGKYSEIGKKSKKEEYYKKKTSAQISRKKRITSIKKLIESNHLSKALTETEKYLEEYPEDSFGLFQHANILYLLDYLEDAKKEFQYIIDHELESKYSSSYKLGVIAIKQEKYDQAYNYFKYNIDNSPYEEIFSIRELSRLELERGNNEEAYHVLVEYSDMKNENILLQAAYVLYAQRRYEEAYEIITSHDFFNGTVLERDYYSTKGYIEVGLGMYDEAEKTLYEALVREKTKFYYKIKSEIAYLYYQKGDLKKSSEACLDVINNSGNSKYMEKALIIFGNICKMSERYEDAKKYYLESTKYDYYKDKRGYLCTGNLCMLQKEYEEARKYYMQYLETAFTKRDYSTCYLKLALLAMKQNKIQEMIKKFNKVKKENLDDIDQDDYSCLKKHIRYINGVPAKLDSYRLRQLYHYSIDELIKHIDKVHTSSMNDSIFNDEIDLEELVFQIPELLSKAKRIDNRYYERYRVEYKEIGYVDGVLTDTLELVVFPESQKVLTMYPVDSNDKEKIITEPKKKTKSKSQIEKFNQKYGIKSET